MMPFITKSVLGRSRRNPSSRGAKRRGDPESPRALRSPRLLRRFAPRNDGFGASASHVSSSHSSGLGDHAETLAGINLVPERAPPPLVVEIPAHRFLNPALERLLRPPAKLAFQLGCVDCVAQIVPWPVGDKGNEGVVRAGRRRKGGKDGADAAHDINVAAFVAAA